MSVLLNGLRFDLGGSASISSWVPDGDQRSWSRYQVSLSLIITYLSWYLRLIVTSIRWVSSSIRPRDRDDSVDTERHQSKETHIGRGRVDPWTPVLDMSNLTKVSTTVKNRHRFLLKTKILRLTWPSVQPGSTNPGKLTRWETHLCLRYFNSLLSFSFIFSSMKVNTIKLR